MYMYRVNIRADTVEIWLQSDVASAEVDALIQRYQEAGAEVVVYRSGYLNLSEMTAWLLQAQTEP